MSGTQDRVIQGQSRTYGRSGAIELNLNPVHFLDLFPVIHQPEDHFLDAAIDRRGLILDIHRDHALSIARLCTAVNRERSSVL